MHPRRPLLSVLFGDNVRTCSRCNREHVPLTQCLYCGKDFKHGECIICASCDLSVLAETERREEEERSHRVDKILAESGVSKPYRSGEKGFEGWRVPSPDGQEALHAADAWASRSLSAPWLYLAGPPGTGKTHLASSALVQAVKSWGEQGRFIDARSFIAFLRNNQDEEARIIASVRDVTFLVIDDLGTENVSEFTINTWYSVLNRRLEDGKPTIITSNYSPANLAARWKLPNDDSAGARVVRRIKDASLVVEITR